MVATTDWAARRRRFRATLDRLGKASPPAAPRRRAARRGGRQSWHRGMLGAPLFDHLIGPCEERRWNRQAECLGGLQVDDQLELGGLLHRQIGRFGALEDLV